MDVVWKIVADKLKADGVDVYEPATHIGECKSNYCVITCNGGSKYNSYSTQQVLYTIYCYVPKNKHSALYDYVEKCKKSLAEIAPQVMPTGQETPDFYDDTNKAHMVSVQYRAFRRNKLL